MRVVAMGATTTHTRTIIKYTHSYMFAPGICSDTHTLLTDVDKKGNSHVQNMCKDCAKTAYFNTVADSLRMHGILDIE
jgi:hypothetical protein